jgi:hypothetical protein
VTAQTTPQTTPTKPNANEIPSIWSIRPDTGALQLSFHAGQARAWDCESRFIAVLAGTQGGKTSFAPWWLAREIERTADPKGGANDYLAVTSTFKLFQRKFLPLMIETYEEVLGIGRYWASAGIIEISDPRDGRFWAKKSSDAMFARILLGSAVSPSGLESTTAKAALLDEAGQPEYTLRAWEAIRRRLSLARGRALLPTTVYDLGWLKESVYDRAKRVDTPQEQPGDKEFAVIHFDSIENPAFPLEEFEAARASMPEWRFNMMYRGMFTRPAGQIYDCFIDEDISQGGHRLRPYTLPREEMRIAGADFGVVNTCFGFYSVEEDEDGYPTGRLIRYRTYHGGGHDATGHVKNVLGIEPNLALVVGGAASEDQWRQAYLWAGLPIYAPSITDVEVGIDNVYGQTRADNLLVFDTDRVYIEQKKSYSRELDEQGNPTTKIKDKEKYHALDTERYITTLFGAQGRLLPFVPRKHLVVGGDALVERYAPNCNRFAGLSYQDGVLCGFVLGYVKPDGTAVTEIEYTALGSSVSEFIKGLKAFLREWGIVPNAQTGRYPFTVSCNDDIFLPTRKGEVSGPAIKESFVAAGFHCVKAGGDGVNEWSSLADWLSRGVLKINRLRCPLLALTLPLLVPDKLTPGSPDKRNPLTLSAALCNALMMRPRPLSLVSAPSVGGDRSPVAPPAGMR